MNKYSIAEQNKIEKAIILISSKFAKLDHLIKPTLLHSIRVGMKLYFHGYETNTVIGGFLHDIIEDTEVSEQNLLEEFGFEIAEIVKGNTKNTAIKDNCLRNEELIKRCLESSEKASIVKAVDILDNYSYYSSLNNQSGIEYCKSNTLFFIKYFNPQYKDKIFKQLFEEVK